MTVTENATGYTVLVDDNFHYMDESERYELGTFATLAEAIDACRRIVDEFLTHTLEQLSGATAEALYSAYTHFGEDPWIESAEGDVLFSAWDYARARCPELCGAPDADARDGAAR